MKYLSLFILLSFLACSKKTSSPDIVTGLVVNIPFDGSAVESVSGTNGTIAKATFADDHHGVSGKAMYFNAADSAVVDFGALPLASFDSTNQFTISCWVKVADTTSSMAILSKRGYTGPFEYSLDSHFDHNGFTLDNWVSSGQTSIYGTDPLKAYAAIQPGVWEHIAYVADGNTLNVYVNGSLQAGSDMHNNNLSFVATSAHLVIGTGGGYGRNYYFNGCIDDIKIYNRALPLAAIQELANL